jgi:hypothetical protein
MARAALLPAHLGFANWIAGQIGTEPDTPG